MRSVLISIRPKWCELIAKGQKTVEVRKTRPKLETPFKVYIYMTAGDAVYPVTINGSPYTCSNVGGKCVIGEFVCRNIDQYDYDYCPHPEIGMDYYCGDNWWEISCDDLDRACLTESEFRQYAWPNTIMYGWHISDLVIYDKPKSLREFSGLRKTKFGYEPISITRPPQSWCYVEEVKQ